MKIFQPYDHKCTATFFVNHSVYRYCVYVHIMMDILVLEWTSWMCYLVDLVLFLHLKFWI